MHKPDNTANIICSMLKKTGNNNIMTSKPSAYTVNSNPTYFLIAFSSIVQCVNLAHLCYFPVIDILVIHDAY